MVHSFPTRRSSDLFLGIGVSGGEEGALLGPSIMPGGTEEAYGEVEGVLTKIAAQADGGEDADDRGGDHQFEQAEPATSSHPVHALLLRPPPPPG